MQQQQQQPPYAPSASYGSLPSAGGYPGGGAPGGQQGFMPGPQQQQQQQYGQPYNQYGPASGHAQFSMPFQPGSAGGQMPGGVMGGGDGGAGFMSGLSPLGLMTAGGLLSGPQQYMQQRMGWLKTNMTGGTMSALFNVTPSYVASKLLMLLAPFLGRWTYTRVLEQIAGGQKYRPPSADVNAPDLYIPLVSAWAYALLNAALLAVKGKFRPEAMSNMAYGACVAWGVHWVVAWLVLRAMSVPGVPWSELLAYTGYPFAAVCLSVVAQQLGGRMAYYAVWGYGCTCMGVFMVRTMKRVIFQEARQYGHDMKMTNYLLLALAGFQFPWAWWLALAPKG
ncbi:MAG: YIF1-domain-containing protein [Monoraphidium minutum]|nr:MAG: YIF1-domain-containing protein [Monoraphidium minutum]